MMPFLCILSSEDTIKIYLQAFGSINIHIKYSASINSNYLHYTSITDF